MSAHVIGARVRRVGLLTLDERDVELERGGGRRALNARPGSGLRAAPLSQSV